MRLKVLALAALFLPLPLLADSFTTFNLNTVEHGNVALPSENVTVKVDLSTNGKTAIVTFDTAPGFYMDDVFLNVSGLYTIDSVTGTQGTYNYGGGGGHDSFGFMSTEVTPTNGKASTEIIVTLDATNPWSNVDAVLTPTTDFGKQYYAAGFDAVATVGTASGGGSPDNLGFGGAIVAPTPEPESLVFVGTGLLSMAGFLRRKLQRA